VKIPIPVGVSNRHMHLTREMLDILFGSGFELTVYRNLLQRGEFASEQFVKMVGPKGAIERVRILGPLREKSQIEISRTDAFTLGLNPPVGLFTKLPDGESITLTGSKGLLTVDENVMISRRHIHISPQEAEQIGVQDQEIVFVAPLTETGDPAQSRVVIFGNVLVRVKDTYVLQMHIDTDEANASGLKSGDQVYVVQSSLRYNVNLNGRRLVTENDVRKAIMQGQKLKIEKGMIVTPAAKELGKHRGVFV
jgi:putative phosphotransacetylase